MSTTDNRDPNVSEDLTGKLRKLPKDKLREVEDIADFCCLEKIRIPHRTEVPRKPF